MITSNAVGSGPFDGLQLVHEPGSDTVRITLSSDSEADPEELRRLVHGAFDHPDVHRVEVHLPASAVVTRLSLGFLGAVHEATLRRPSSGPHRGAPPPMVLAVHRDELRNESVADGVDNDLPAATRLQTADASDVEALYRLEQSAFGVGYDRGQLRQLLALFPGLTWLATQDGDAVGYISCGIVLDEPRHAWILSMGVHRDCQGRGVGTSLLEESLRALRERRIEVVHLSVDPARPRTVAFYRRHDFRAASHVADYFGPGEPRTIMCRDL